MNRQQRRAASKHTTPQRSAPPASFDRLLSLAQMHQTAGHFHDAETVYRQLIAIQPTIAELYHNLGFVLERQGHFDDATAILKNALALKPNLPETYMLLGNIHAAFDRFSEAAGYFEKAISLNPHYAKAHHNLGYSFYKQNDLERASTHISHVLALMPENAEAHNTMGCIRIAQGQFAEAEECYKRLFAIDPTSPSVLDTIGRLLMQQDKPADAIHYYSQAVTLDPTYAQAYYDLGAAQFHLKRYDEARGILEQLVAFTPELPLGVGLLLLINMYQCRWTTFDTLVNRLSDHINNGDDAAVPFALLPTPLSISQQSICAQTFDARHVRPGVSPRGPFPHYAHKRLRIGYFSSAFRSHPLSRLLPQFFELHDRSRFEITAFSMGPPSQDALRQRLEHAFDRFIDVRNHTDADIAALASSMELDIAIDLNGQTEDSRRTLFARRVAPIQVAYMGYPGTSGAPYIDYLIADSIVVPDEHTPFYTEKIVRLPHTYWVTDATRGLFETPYTRQEMGLPNEAFVFCCFNNNYKITPDVFAVWMRLLRQIDGSVLWLFEGTPTAAANLRMEAKARGVAEDRLVFAKRMDQDAHLARHRLADLFLDTLYCNAHTTASDALWVGLPVLTRLGDTFAGRVAASLLNAVGLPELITHSHAEYEALALDLASDAPRLAALKRKLVQNRLTCPLFNTAAFTRNFETACIKMLERRQSGKAPDHLQI